MERLLAGHTLIWAAEDIAGTVVEGDSEDKGHNLHPSLSPDFRYLPDKRIQIKHEWTGLGFMKKQTLRR